MPAPVPVSSSAAKSKDPKKVAAGRAGAAARKAKQERLLQELRAAKEAIAPTATPVADEAVTDTETTSRRVKQQAVPADPVVALQHVKTDWTPWILFGAGLAALCVAGTTCRANVTIADTFGVGETDGTSAETTAPRGSFFRGQSTWRHVNNTPVCSAIEGSRSLPYGIAVYHVVIMASSPTKNIANDLYHAAVVGGLAIGYAKLGQMVFKGPLPRLDLTPRDAGMAILDLSAAMATKDMLIKQGLIPSDIVK